MANIRVTGTGFLTAAEGAVDRLTFAMLAGPDREYYDPGGPNTGLTQPGATVLTWTNTIIEVGDPGINGDAITDANVRDIDGDYNVTFDVVPDLVVPVLTVTYDDILDRLVVQSDVPIYGGPEQIWADIVGTNTNSAVGMTYVSDTEAYYGSALVALNAPTDILTVRISRSVAFPDRVTAATWEGNVPIPSAGDSGVITSVVQSAFDEITINGYDLLNNTTNPVMQVSVYFSSVPLGPGNVLTFYLPGSVNFGSNDPGSGFGPVTDTAIVISNPQIAAANGAVIEDVEAQDDPYTWPTTAVFDVSPDLVMV